MTERAYEEVKGLVRDTATRVADDSPVPDFDTFSDRVHEQAFDELLGDERFDRVEAAEISGAVWDALYDLAHE